MCIFQLIQKVREGKISEEKFMKLMKLVEKIENQEDMKVEYQKVVSENFWDLV